MAHYSGLENRRNSRSCQREMPRRAMHQSPSSQHLKVLSIYSLICSACLMTLMAHYLPINTSQNNVADDLTACATAIRKRLGAASVRTRLFSRVLSGILRGHTMEGHNKQFIKNNDLRLTIQNEETVSLGLGRSSTFAWRA